MRILNWRAIDPARQVGPMPKVGPTGIAAVALGFEQDRLSI
jgi:hypothetical protein